jgi:hypothetical protein
LVGSKLNRYATVFRHRNISRGNTKSLYGYIDDFISCLEGRADNSLCSKGSSVDDEAPTNIQITNVNLTAGHPAIAPIGILSADDKDTEASKLIFTTDSIGFTIVRKVFCYQSY